jgi:hypothetical protein
MDRTTYIELLNKGTLNLSTYFEYYKLGKGTLEIGEFEKYFPQFYRLVPHIHSVINNRVIAVMDNHYKVNIVTKDGNIIKRY